MGGSSKTKTKGKGKENKGRANKQEGFCSMPLVQLSCWRLLLSTGEIYCLVYKKIVTLLQSI